MIPVASITEEELDKRFDSLPDQLKEALTAERNLRIINQVCDRNRIVDEDKRTTIQQIAGLVILGVLHYYDIGSEINEALSLNNPQFSSSLADELNTKIFAQIKSELESNYQPIAVTTGDIKPPGSKTAVVPAKSTATPSKTISATLSAVASAPTGPKIISEVPSSTTPPPPQNATQPKMPEAAGWSRATLKQPVVKLDQTASAAPVAPRAPAAPAPSAPITIPPARGPIGEFERLAMKRSEGIAPAAPPAGIPKPPTPPPGPPPMILHEDVSAKPQQRAPDFHLDLPSEKFAMQKGPASLPIRPAVVELGKVPPLPAPKMATSTPRVVHYTEYKPPLTENPTFPNPAAQRKITELTAVPSVPPAPLKALPPEPVALELPMPPKFPTPSTPPAPPPPPPKK